MTEAGDTKLQLVRAQEERDNLQEKLDETETRVQWYSARIEELQCEIAVFRNSAMLAGLEIPDGHTLSAEHEKLDVRSAAAKHRDEQEDEARLQAKIDENTRHPAGFDVGRRVKVVKDGSRFYGCSAVIMESNFHGGRLKVLMEEDPRRGLAARSFKNYHEEELALIDEAPGADGTESLADGNGVVWRTMSKDAAELQEVTQQTSLDQVYDDENWSTIHQRRQEHYSTVFSSMGQEATAEEDWRDVEIERLSVAATKRRTDPPAGRNGGIAGTMRTSAHAT
jgi:hypothetical protein